MLAAMDGAAFLRKRKLDGGQGLTQDPVSVSAVYQWQLSASL